MLRQPWVTAARTMAPGGAGSPGDAAGRPPRGLGDLASSGRSRSGSCIPGWPWRAFEPRKKIEGLLFDGVDVGRDDLAVNEGHRAAVPVLADAAYPLLPRLDDAAMGAKAADDDAVLHPVPEHRVVGHVQPGSGWNFAAAEAQPPQEARRALRACGPCRRPGRAPQGGGLKSIQSDLRARGP